MGRITKGPFRVARNAGTSALKAPVRAAGSDVVYPVIGFGGAEFSEEEVNHPQAFGGSYIPCLTDLTGFLNTLESNGFEFAKKIGINPDGLSADDFDYLIGFSKRNSAPNHPTGMRSYVLMRHRVGGMLWCTDYRLVVDYDEWCDLAVEILDGWGFSPSDIT